MTKDPLYLEVLWNSAAAQDAPRWRRMFRVLNADAPSLRSDRVVPAPKGNDDRIVYEEVA